MIPRAQLRLGIGSLVFLLVLSGALGVRLHREALASTSSAPQVELSVLDASGKALDPRNARVSISRGLPGDLAWLTQHHEETLDAQSVRFQLCSSHAELAKTLGVQTTKRSGNLLAALRAVELSPVVDRPGSVNGKRCVQTPLIRVTVDAQDADYASERSLEGELGGYLQLSGQHGLLASLPVGGPREMEIGSGILQAKLRVRIVRTFPGGVPPFGRDDSAVVGLLQREIHIANQLWGQCGITFGDESAVDIAVVDPPPPYLLAIGCGFGVSAGGGEINVLVDHQRLSVTTKAGEVPRAVALRVALAAERLGLRAVVQTNPRMLAGALASFDVEFRRPSGQWAILAPVPGRALSSDATLGVSVGIVDLSDGLDHFMNVSSMTGTLEERALLRATIDADPTTIDLVVVEAFSRVGRIGESFAASEAGSVGNVIVLNRAAFRVGARSYALAHELGHVLLARPGHPDDYGVDTPWNLMDSDAVDGTVFGPKHLTLDDCRGAWLQSGQQPAAMLLKPW
jgi:hypothetical protein